MRAEAVVYVGDLDAMSSFYERCFSLDVAESAKGFRGLQSGAWRLTLVQSADAVPRTTPPPRRAQTPIKLAIEVESIAAVRILAAKLGGGVDPSDSEWRFRHATRCDAVDPEGNIIQLIEGDSG